MSRINNKSVKGIFKMADKTIIDGIDVSKCKSFFKGIKEHNICCYCDTREDKIPFAVFCEENPNCYYKQLKRKEQECEELTRQRDKFEFGNNILEHERNNYKHVLDKIEHQVTELFLGVENKDRTYCKKILDIINSVKDKNVPHKAKDGE